MTTSSLKSRIQEWRKAREPGIKELRFALSRIRRNKLSLAGLFIIVFFVVMAASAPFLAPPGPAWDIGLDRNPFIMPKGGVAVEPAPPSAQHPLGLSVNGFDVFYGCVWGSITAFRVGVFVVAISLAIGLTIGLTAGFYGGLVDEVLMRFTDVIIAFPGLILSMALVVALPSELGLGLLPVLIVGTVFFSLFGMMNLFSRTRTRAISRRFLVLMAAALGFLVGLVLVLVGIVPQINVFTITLARFDKVIIALVLVGWPGYTRVIRGEVLRARSEDYVEAARAIGASDARIITRHIVPNTIYPILIMASLDIGSIVLLAAGLSFLGIGNDANFADWGQLIQQSQEWLNSTGSLMKFWYIWLVPGAFIFTFSLGWNLLGDAVRDILDPTLRRR